MDISIHFDSDSKKHGSTKKLHKLSVSNGMSNMNGMNGIRGMNDMDDMDSMDGMDDTDGLDDMNSVNGTNGYHSSSSNTRRSSVSYNSKTSILRERTVRMSQSIRMRFGGSSDVFLDHTNSFDDFIDAVADIRLRFMPHSGSKWDKVLRWAEGFCTYVCTFHDVVEEFMLDKMGPGHTTILTKVFSVLHRLGLSISLLLRQENLLTATADIRRELAHAYSDLMELTCAVSMHYLTQSQRDQRIGIDGFNAHFGFLINAYYQHRDEVADGLWSIHMKGIFEGGTRNFYDIRGFLEPPDRAVREILSRRFAFGPHRADFTCEWFKYHLNDFMLKKNKILLVTGPGGCGKTMLSDWIVESLRGSMDPDPHDAIFYRVWTDIHETTSSLSLVKNLVFQAAHRNIGDETLISHVRRAMNMAATGAKNKDVEKVLWKALEHVASHSKLAIVVDGLDQLSGNHQTVLDHLHSIAAPEKHNCKVIVLSRPLQKPAPSKTQLLSISEDRILQDIKLFIQSRMDDNKEIFSMSATSKGEITQKIADKSRGSFLWAECAFRRLKNERNPVSFTKWLDNASKHVDRFFGHHVDHLQLDKPETLPILSWILAAERPLSVIEIRHLLEIDTKNCTTAHRYDDINETIRHTIGPLVDIDEGIVCLKYPSMRPYLVTFQSENFSFDMRKAQTSLALKLLAYVKLHVHEDIDINWAPVRPHEAKTYFESHALLEYAARSWASHFRGSRFYSEDKGIEVDKRLRQCWPRSTLLSVLEGACFRWGSVGVEMEVSQRISFEIRKTILGHDSTATLQSLLFLVQHYKQTQHSDLAALAYEAWEISKTVSDTTVALECAQAFVLATKSLTVKKRTEVLSRREQVLQFLISTYKRTGGVSHELTIKYTKSLAELYVTLKEIKNAVVLYRELYNVTIERHGYFHEETSTMYHILIAQLKAIEHHDIVLQTVEDYNSYVCKTLSVEDERRVKSTMSLVAMYEDRKEVTHAEEVLVSYWKSVTSSASVEIKVDVAVEYSKFLRRHERTEEAEAVMRGVYSEVETYEETYEESSSMHTRIKSIAEEFKSLKSFSMARSIYSSLWSQTKELTESSFSEEIATALAETVTEEIESKTDTITTTSTSSTLTVEEESTLREVFESSLSMSSKSALSSMVKTGVALSSSFYKKEMYQEAATTYSQVLSKTWSSIEISETSVHEQSEEMIEVAMNMADCYFQMLQIEKSEIIYANIFHSLLRSQASHKWLMHKAKMIIEYHKRIYRFEKAIMYYRELCLHLQQRLGKSHWHTIELFSEYGALARKVCKHKEAIEAYHCIHLAYKLKNGCIEKEGIKASLALCELYEEEHCWHEAHSVYSALWVTIRKHGKEFKFSHAHIERVYERHTFIMETKIKKEYEAVRKLALDYRTTCKEMYGEKHELTVKATVRLAEMCEHSESHQEEALSLYEEAFKHSSKTKIRTTSISEESSSSTTTTTTVSSLARKKLAEMYSHSESSSTRAVTLHEEQRSFACSEYGASSSESLTATRELVATYKRQNTSESRTKAVSTLRSSVFEIFKTERSSERVLESARSLARTYVECGFASEAKVLVKELRGIIIEKVRETRRVESSRNVFIAAFEEVVEQRSFSAAIADMRSEIFLYTSYFEESTSPSALITACLERGARLRVFLLESDRLDEAERIEAELFATFVKHLSTTSTTTDKRVLDALFSICLAHASSDDSHTVIIERAVHTVREYANAACFAQALDMAALLHRYASLAGGFTSAAIVHAVARLCLCLTGRGTSGGGGGGGCKRSHAGLHARMLDLSRTMLRQALEACGALGVSLTDMRVDELADVVELLGEQRNYEDLERVLAALWSSRAVHRTWSTPLVLAIARRLIETRAARGRVDDAVALAEDVRYNLERVWGPLDEATLDFTALLSALYTAHGRCAEALQLHENVLARLVGAGAGEDWDDGSVKGVEEGARVAVAQLEEVQRPGAHVWP
ncbi:hypothetical protein SLS56_005854 [Neofusicoccum ribis]|uniref:Nephrocystin 3-like N-terminal domain-containing protein n=1 Tax=Neofusicoccum ribis TaxID=45134 RepID=A0ABR3ST14_9PEZI